MQKRSRGPFIRPRQVQREHKLNNEITAPEVRVVGENIEPGVYPIAKAIQMAQELEVDLVEISPNAVPPRLPVDRLPKVPLRKEEKRQGAESKIKTI